MVHLAEGFPLMGLIANNTMSVVDTHVQTTSALQPLIDNFL